MSTEKTKEELIREDLASIWTRQEMDSWAPLIAKLMRLYADRESAIRAVEFGIYLAKYVYLDDFVSADSWFDPAGQRYTTAQMFEKFMTSNTINQ